MTTDARAALAAALREAEDADAAEGHTPTCHEPWEYRIADRLAAMPPGWCGHERTTRLFMELSDSYTEAEAEIARLKTDAVPVDAERLARLKRDTVAIATQRNEARAALTSLRERVEGIPPFVDQSYRGASDDERLAAATIDRAAVLDEIDRALGEPS